MTISISRYHKNGTYTNWWKNFDNHHTPNWNYNKCSWLDYIESLGYFKFGNDAYKNLIFETEEDMINFLIKWS